MATKPNLSAPSVDTSKTVVRYTVAQQRKDRAAGKGRPGRSFATAHKGLKVEKERTKVLTARVGEVAFNRFSISIGHQPGTKGSKPIGPFLEEAMELWLLHSLKSAKGVVFVSSETMWLNGLSQLLATFERRYKRGKLKSDVYLHFSYPFPLKKERHTFVVLPDRMPEKKREKLLLDILGVADKGISAVNKEKLSPIMKAFKETFKRKNSST